MPPRRSKGSEYDFDEDYDSIVWNLFLPFAIMTGCVEHAEYHDGVRPKHVENSVGEMPGEDATNIGPSTQTSVLVWIGNNPLNSSLRGGQKPLSQSVLLLFMPGSSVGQVGFRLSANDKPVGHWRSLF